MGEHNRKKIQSAEMKSIRRVTGYTRLGRKANLLCINSLADKKGMHFFSGKTVA